MYMQDLPEDDKWSVVKTMLSNDISVWKETLFNLEARKKLSIDLEERAELDMMLGTLAIYEAVLEHYLGIMEELDKVDDGGTETSDT